MKDFWVYFEIYGKRMKAKIKAFKEEDAKMTIKNKIIFHKIEGESLLGKGFDEMVDSFLKGFSK